MSDNLKFGLVNRCVSVSRSVDQTVLSIVCSGIAMDVDRKYNWNEMGKSGTELLIQG